MTDCFIHIFNEFLKRKKEAKKEKAVEMWETLRVSHIPTALTNNSINCVYFF
jgi:hypothetical protein